MPKQQNSERRRACWPTTCEFHWEHHRYLVMYEFVTFLFTSKQGIFSLLINPYVFSREITHLQIHQPIFFSTYIVRIRCLGKSGVFSGTAYRDVYSGSYTACLCLVVNMREYKRLCHSLIRKLCHKRFSETSENNPDTSDRSAAFSIGMLVVPRTVLRLSLSV